MVTYDTSKTGGIGYYITFFCFWCLLGTLALPTLGTFIGNASFQDTPKQEPITRRTSKPHVTDATKQRDGMRSL